MINKGNFIEGSKKPSLKETFPLAAVVIEAFRKAFGDGVELIYVSEGGREVGRPLDENRFKVLKVGDMNLNVNKNEAGHGK